MQLSNVGCRRSVSAYILEDQGQGGNCPRLSRLSLLLLERSCVFSGSDLLLSLLTNIVFEEVVAVFCVIQLV